MKKKQQQQETEQLSVYLVKYDEVWEGLGDSIPSESNVLAPDAEEALTKVRSEVVGAKSHDGRCECLDRYPDKDGHYEKDNVRWATQKQQMRNTRSNRMITWQGETKTLTEWCEVRGLHYRNTWQKLKRGKSVEEVFS